jgi:aminoglycoside/choline kinase family phosphotransferase
MNRDDLIALFLARNGFPPDHLEPLAQDASFRRYLRIRGDRPAVLMDAPPPENVRPFLRIAAHLRSIGLRVPRILAADEACGLVLEEDLGDDLVSVLLDEGEPVDRLLEAAVDEMVGMQQAAPPDRLPLWDRRQWRPPPPARCSTGGGQPDRAPAPHAARDEANALATMLAPGGRPTFVHRDFFAGNLLRLSDRGSRSSLGRFHRSSCLRSRVAAAGHVRHPGASRSRALNRYSPRA